MLFCALLYVSLSSNSTGPGMAGTGDRTTAGCGGSGCHSMAPSGTFTISGVVLMDAAGTTTVSSYTPGGSYRILIGAGLTILPNFGFQVKATTAAGNTAGTMMAPVGTHTVSAGGDTLCEHSMALNAVTGIDSISVPWIAPAAGTGTVTLRGVLNAVDGTGSTSGDMYIVMPAYPVSEATGPAIAGTFTVCAGSTTSLTHPTPGGTWSSSTPAIGTISTSGVVAGIAAGTTTISYNTGTATATQVVTVSTTPNPVISGSSAVCVAHTITLTGTPAGGTWTSVFTAKATITAAGVVSGVATGVDTIKYQVTNGCGTNTAKKVLTINPNSSSCGLAVNTVTTEEFNIYPNPNRGSFTLDLASPFNGQAYIVVTNATGAKVKDFTVEANNKVDVVLNQPPGVYFIAATTLTQRYFVKVVVE